MTVARNCKDGPNVSYFLTLFRMGIFGAGHGWEGGKKAPLPKICHTHPTMMKFSTVIPYLKRIQKIYESRDTPPNCFNKPGCNFDDVSKNWLHQAFSK